MYNQTPDLSKMPEGATHWAAESDHFMECWYKFDGTTWYGINYYWLEHHPGCWYSHGSKLARPMSDLIPMPDLSKAPEGATHWAPENDNWLECWYRFENDLWYHVNSYWASDIAERPYGMPAQNWKTHGEAKLKRPLTDLIKL